MEDQHGSNPSQGDTPDSESLEDLTKRIKELLAKLEHSNPGSSELIISELGRVGDQITGAIQLLDQSMRQVGTAVRDNATRTENVQNTLNYLRWAIWPSLLGIVGAIVSIWLRKPSP